MLAKTPSSFGKIKIFFRVNQILNLTCDALMSGIIQPAPFYPYCCVAVLGPIKYIIHNPVISYAIIFFLVIVSVSTAIGSLFFRYQAILDKKSLFSEESHIIYTTAVICLLFGVNIIIAIIIGETSDEDRRITFLPEHPSFEVFFTYENTFADQCMPNYFYLIITLCLSEGLLVSWGLFSIIGCIKTLSYTGFTVSEKTKKLQKKFTICLLIQFAIPLIMVGLPCSYIILTMVLDICTSETWIFNITAYLSISVHSVIFSIVTLLLTDSYRMYLFPFLKNKIQRSHTLDPTNA